MIPDNKWKLNYAEKPEEWINYLKDSYPYFDLCANKNVLELAPFCGTHTQLIESHGAKSITMVELNEIGITQLQFHYPKHTIVNDDVFNYLQTKRKFDVVVCCGLLYHLHSPLYLLELIANMVDPEFLYIETYTSPELCFREESDNDMGMRHLIPNHKSTKLSLLLPEDILLLAIKNLGYKLITETKYLGKPVGAVKLWIFKRT